MTPNQKAALRQALGTHSLGMVTKSMTPEELQELPEDYQVPTYTANASPLYDNQLFPKITSAEDLIDIGYATPDGRSTQSGQMAIALKKAGALNDDYTLNDTGKAMMANPADLLEEENLPLYLKAKELDLDGSGRELSWGETFGRFYKESKDSVKALYNIASGPASTTKEEKAAFDLEVQAGLGGAVKSGAALAMGLFEIAGSGLIKALSDTEAEEDLALASLNQRFEKLDYEIKNAKAADVIDGLGEMVGAELGVGEAREQNIQTVGEERAKEIERRGESAGQFAAMFSPYGPAAMTGKVAFGVAGKGLGAAFKPISRSLLQADLKAAQVLDKTKQLAALQRQASGLQVATQAAEKKTVFAESMAQRLSQAGLVDRANNAMRIANQFRTTGQEAATRLGGFTDEIATVSDDLAKATQSANVADKVLQVTQKARQIPYLPITALGKTLEATGRGMIGIDKGLSSLASKIGADKAYNAMNKITSLSGLGGAGAALGLGPAAFIPAAIRATWSTAPFIKATGEYISLVGKEATKARGQIGFWKRIYEMPNKGPAHRAVSGLMDTATMGGRIPGAVSNVAKGLVASYPVDLAYEWVSEGGDFNPNILKQAAVETLFFGGTGAALGGITMGGANRIKTLQNGDALNFYRSISDPSQRVMYNGMPSDMKRVIGTFSASNPGAKIQFVDQGAGAYDRNTKTVMVNPNAANPLKPLLTHEFMHHMLNNGIGDGVVAQLVGDGFQTGGLLRGRDGSYDPQYEAFKNEYVNRLRSQHERTVKMRDAIGDPMTKSEREFQTPDEKYLAEEYFIEVNVDDMLGMAESGKLGGIAGRMIINDKARALGDAILNKSAILRDLHFRIGGVMDNKGKMVTGNGFLSGKLYQSPEVRRMFQKMVNESVGRKGGIDAAKRKARNGIEIPVTGKNDPILGEVSSLWETDADGNPYLDASGEYIPLKKETDELRSQAGMLLVDDLKSRQARGEVIPDGELSYNPDNNTWSGQYLNDRQIELLNLSGRFNSKQIKQLKLLNAAARDTSNATADPASRGHRFSVIYQPALKKNRKGQWRYDQIKPQLRDVVPYGVEISKDGNILIRVMSTNQLFANASEKSASKRGRALYDGNMETILRDVNAVIDSHGKNQPTDAYFKDKYGGQWEQHKSFINSVFGNVGAGQKDINPLVATDRVDAVVKSYRLDRMNKATQLVGSTQLPYQNNLVKINYLPEGEPIMDADGDPKDLRYTPSYESVSQVRMPEQARQMPEGLDADYMKAVESGDMESAQRMVDEAARKAGYDIENIAYHGTNIDFNNFDISDKIGVWTGAESTASLFSRIRASRSGSPRVIKGYIKAQNTAPAGQDLEVSGEDAIRQREKLIADGFDSIESPGKFKIVLSPEQIKSADPITRDDSGNVIPLSQRFNEKSSDIRYMPEPVKKEKKKKERQIIGEDRVIDKGDEDTLDVIQAIGAKTKEPSWKDDKPVPVSFGYDLTTAPHIDKFAGNVEDPSTAFLDDIPYDLNGAEKERVEKLIKNGVVDYLANDMVERTRIALENPAIAAGRGWYSRMRVKLLNAFGDVGREIFSQFLGATSAQTPVDENFQQAVDANEGMNSGRYDRHREGYLKAIKAESEGTLDTEITKTRSVENIKGIIGDLKEKLPSVTTKADRIAIYAELKSLEDLIDIPVDERTVAQRIKIYVVGNDLLPRRSNGAKFNANSGAVLKVIAGVWLNNRKSPKTPNFAGNLSGRTVQATIDIWAARFLRRQIYGGQGVPWRIQPKSEVGVSNEDFAFAQVVMARAAKKLGMNPDDLQAILWFAEKDVWDKKGWTKNEGAKKSSFDDIFDIFFPEGKKPLSFAEGSALIKATKDREKAIAKEEEKAKIKAEAKALGMSIAALNRMKKAEK